MTDVRGGTDPKAFRVRRSKHNPDGRDAQEREPGTGPEDSLKQEVARELGLADDLANPDELSVREAGKIGGHMVRRLVREGKRVLAKRPPGGDGRTQG